VSDGCRVVLVGMMGSGKTTVGRRLAALTGWPLHDNDELVARLFDATPREILATGGEPKLRDAESEALAMGLEAPAPSIVGAAAGTILDEANRRQLREVGTVVWLRAAAATVTERAMGAAHRPWLDTGGVDWVESAVADRAPLYASVADLTVETDGRPPAAIVKEIVARLPEVNPGCWPAPQPRRRVTSPRGR
jgi:shikimate kinase